MGFLICIGIICLSATTGLGVEGTFISNMFFLFSRQIAVLLESRSTFGTSLQVPQARVRQNPWYSRCRRLTEISPKLPRPENIQSHNLMRKKISNFGVVQVPNSQGIASIFHAVSRLPWRHHVTRFPFSFRTSTCTELLLLLYSEKGIFYKRKTNYCLYYCLCFVMIGGSAW